jgi:hypothetical protein
MTDPLEQLNEVTAMIIEARDAVADGAFVDLQEIQARVQNICLEIQGAPPADAITVETKITTMIADLNRLAEDLKAQQRSLGSNVVRKAVRKAYKMPKDEP